MHATTILLFSLSFDISQLRGKLLVVFAQLRQTRLTLQEIQSSLGLPNRPVHCNIFHYIFIIFHYIGIIFKHSY